MTRTVQLSAGFAAVLVSSLAASPTLALNDVSFVASTGAGTACTRAAPCNDIGTALGATNSGGIINCLDSGPIFGTVIFKSITIDCEGFVSNIGVAGAGIVVKLRNLTLDPIISGSISLDFSDGAALFVENCVIQNQPSFGIRFRPSSPGAQLVVTDTVLTNNGSGSTGAGILVSPQAGGSAQVALNRVTVGKNVFGIAADGTGSTGGINMIITDSVASGNSQDGIVATTPSGGAPIGVLVKNTRSVNNNIGIRSIGPNVTVRVDGSTVTGNGTGLNFISGGALLSFGNNNVIGNGANGAFSGTVGLQ